MADAHGDFADVASQYTEQQLQDAIAAHQLRPRLKATGHCYNCEENLDSLVQLFCDPHCRDDYAKREHQRKQKLY